MTKEKMNKLYNISKIMASMLRELGITNYNGYSSKFTSQGIFLILRDTYITLTLEYKYIDENLNNFIPATTLEIMKQFDFDLEHDFFETLENVYVEYIK